MSAPIHSLLADELDISEEMSEKLLSAMLREVRKRARQGQKGVRLPDLGKFIVEDGELRFRPTEGLKRAVNHRFEGLESEDLSSAPRSGEPDEEDSGGPSTIRLGYQDKGWNPIDGPEPDEADNAEESAATSDDDGADTEEFQSPAADSTTGETTADTPPDDTTDAPPSSSTEEPAPSESASSPTEEVSPPESGASDPASEPDAQSPSSPDDETEKLYPLVDEMSDDPTAGDGSDEAPPPSDSPSTSSSDDEERNDDLYERERDTLSEIWNDDSDDEEPDTESVFDDATSALDTGGTEESESPSPDQPASEAEPDTGARDFGTGGAPLDTDEDALDEDAFSEESSGETQSEPVPEPARPEPESSASILRVLVTVLVLILLGGGAWYILGQRGLVPSPGQTFTQLGGQTTTPGSSEPAAADADESDEASSSTDGTSGERSPSSSESDPGASGDSAPDRPQQGLDPSAGGWTVVVASRGDRGTATDLVETYRQRFDDRDVPVDLIEGTVDGSTRYRVGVGQFRSQIEAESFLDANSSAMPDGAWPLELE